MNHNLPKCLVGFEIEDYFVTREDGYKGLVFYVLLSGAIPPNVIVEKLQKELNVKAAKGTTIFGIRIKNEEKMMMSMTIGFGRKNRETVESATFLDKSSRCKILVSFRDSSPS
ncbi:hypothetical protein [Armatimonas sp.]|uniref:hypothetical protein n=1 Tax=Armatimonas sp. TaxID=1872638 RepID=UPI00286B1900|nr:hypothetical protein [Armatimonas sp.]